MADLQGLPTAAQEIRLRAVGLARVLAIPPGTFTGREPAAYQIMSHLAAMLTIPDHGRRHAYGNEILQNSNRLLPIDQPQNAQFSGRLREQVIMMQEFPAWYSKLTRNNDEIVNDYLNLKLITTGMKIVGLGSLSVAGIAGGAVKTGLKGAQAASGLRAQATAAATGALTGARNAATGGLARGLGVGWVIGSVAYVAIEARMIELGDEITRRYQEQRLPGDLYQKAFGDGIALPQRYLHPIR